jgi:hypothetical protein
VLLVTGLDDDRAYARRGRGDVPPVNTRARGAFIRFVRLAILNLAGVPSIVFGLFGFGMFVIFFGWNVSCSRAGSRWRSWCCRW